MQIQLKQAEIVAALKQYITQQGIQLKDKEVTITFTAGRKEGGLSADLVIEDAGIPGFTDSHDTEETKDTKETKETKHSEAPALVIVKDVSPAQDAAGQSHPAAIADPETDPPVVKTNSLFS